MGLKCVHSPPVEDIVIGRPEFDPIDQNHIHDNYRYGSRHAYVTDTRTGQDRTGQDRTGQE